MYNHAPEGYACHFCRIINGLDNEGWNCQSDVFWRTEHITALVNTRWWVNTPGHVLVLPNRHIENIYDLTPDIAVHVHEAARQVAIAFKKCMGVTGHRRGSITSLPGIRKCFIITCTCFPGITVMNSTSATLNTV